MSWYPDLSPYTYLQEGERCATFNVGWLAHGHTFRMGRSPKAFVERLTLLTTYALTQGTRGVHKCDLCSPGDPDLDDDSMYGHAEIRAVGDDGVRYAAPMLVLHYVVKHQYLPPQCFIDAVLRVADVSWRHAQANDICLSCGSAMIRVNTEHTFNPEEREPVVVARLDCNSCGTAYSRRLTVPTT
jgi:hypothetical protein